MPTRSEAEEHLRVIRSLMEKATIYRAISAPTALVGGLLAFVTAGTLWRLTPAPPGGESGNWPNMRWFFLMPWLLVLALTAAANIYFLWHDARLRGDPFISPGMKAAVNALAPSFIVAGYFTFFLAGCSPGLVVSLPTIWMVLYGLGLLATAHFSPRSMHFLGWSFLVAGLASFTGAWLLPWLREPWQICNFQMAATFGLFHLIYAACTWPRKLASGIQP